MYFSSKLTFLAATLAVALARPEIHQEEQCGGLLPADSTGFSYKLFDSYTPGEQCVWSLSLSEGYHTTNNYSLQLILLGSSASELFATCVNGASESEQIATYSLTETGVEVTTMRCDSLLITFIGAPSNPNGDPGFALKLSSSALSGQGFEAGKNFVVSGGMSGVIKNPEPSNANYRNNELTTYVFVPSPNSTLDVIYAAVSLFDRNDYLEIYVYNPTNPLKWESQGRIDGTVDDQLFTTTEITLVAFRTDQSNARLGYFLTATECSGTGTSKVGRSCSKLA